MPLTVVGLLGTKLDATGSGPLRWSTWRPTVSIFQHDHLMVDRLVLMHPPQATALAGTTVRDIARLSPQTTIDLVEFGASDPWDFEDVYAELLAFAEDWRGRLSEDEVWIHITTGTHVAQICLFLLAESGFLAGKLLQTRPEGNESAFEVIDLDLARYDRIAQRFAQVQQDATHRLKAGIATRNKAFNLLIDRIERVSVGSTAPILLMGPTGAGKTELARRIYALKLERGQVGGAMVEVNCATLRGDHAMSTLFGHRRGAYTGAINDRRGLLSSADGGLLFLDEIGELGLDEQAMLLRALEEHRFLPIGADTETHSDFQLIAGTNRDLRAEVASGQFRADLLARIDLWTFRLPALRDRIEDIEPNVDFELERFARSASRRVSFNQEARERFLRYATLHAPWTGNFRDLSAAITRMATLAPQGRIRVEEVDEEIARLSQARSTPISSGLVMAALGERTEQLDLFDQVQLEVVLQVCIASRSLAEAGRELFAYSRSQRTTHNDADRLRKYLSRFGLSREDISRLRSIRT